MTMCNVVLAAGVSVTANYTISSRTGSTIAAAPPAPPTTPTVGGVNQRRPLHTRHCNTAPSCDLQLPTLRHDVLQPEAGQQLEVMRHRDRYEALGSWERQGQ